MRGGGKKETHNSQSILLYRQLLLRRATVIAGLFFTRIRQRSLVVLADRIYELVDPLCIIEWSVFDDSLRWASLDGAGQGTAMDYENNILRNATPLRVLGSMVVDRLGIIVEL